MKIQDTVRQAIELEAAARGGAAVLVMTERHWNGLRNEIIEESTGATVRPNNPGETRNYPPGTRALVLGIPVTIGDRNEIVCQDGTRISMILPAHLPAPEPGWKEMGPGIRAWRE